MKLRINMKSAAVKWTTLWIILTLFEEFRRKNGKPLVFFLKKQGREKACLLLFSSFQVKLGLFLGRGFS